MMRLSSFFCCLISVFGAPPVSTKEMLTLQEFYVATDGPQWTIRAGFGIAWNFTEIDTQNPCSDPVWYGISCIENQTNSYISELDLSISNLRGAIPSSISNLTQLNHLDLNNNYLSGCIPSEIAELLLLNNVTVNFNFLTSTLPANLHTMTNLVAFSVTNNLLNGTIPENLSELELLEELSLDTNHFSGNIPVAFGQFRSLKVLSIRNNYLKGVIPAQLGNISTLEYIFLNDNELTGSLPAELGQLSLLRVLSITKNQLSGTFPSAITSNLTLLEVLLLSTNRFTGTIPQDLCSNGSGTQLRNLELSFNNFSGPIPNNISQCAQLTHLYLTGNNFTGTIPNNIGNLQNCVNLLMDDNRLNGTIPSSLGDIVTLEVLELNNNYLTGIIPPELGKLTQLQQLVLIFNLLTGPIPESLGSNNTALRFLYLNNNLLTGTISPNICDLKSLRRIYFNNNLLIGSIPLCIGHLADTLAYLSLGYNQLSGSLPPSFAQLNKLVYTAIYYNALTGTIPNDIGNMVLLEIFQLLGNQFTGALPTSISDLHELYVFTNSLNYFTGSLPDFHAVVHIMEALDCGFNLFSGSVPSSYSQFASLHTLVLQLNLLTGSLDTAFNSTVQTALSYVSLSYNEFTGDIPSEVFKIPTLLEFELISNCMSGTIPVEICGANQLTTLLLDGLSAGSSCQSKIFPNIAESTSYYLTKHLTGHIPSCLFSAPALQTLHLSGNSITGSIAADTVFSAALTDVTLSHNQLTGSVPAQMQKHNWTTLDLSFNKFKGILLDTFSGMVAGNVGNIGGNNSISLQDNRFSGEIPQSLTDAENIQLVSGNMFSCGIADRDSLPSHDSDSDNYQCGSNSLDLSMYFYTVGLSLFMLLVMCVYLLLRRDDKSHWASLRVGAVMLWYQNALKIQLGTAAGQYIALLSEYRHLMLHVCCIFLIVLLPAYGALSVYYSSYEHVYAWSVSAAFLSGQTAGAVLFALWMVGILFLLVVVLVAGQTKQDKLDNSGENTDKPLTWVTKLLVVLCLLVNLLVVVGINVFYVWVTLNASDQFDITVTEVFVALFKLVWNDLVVPRLFIYARATDHLNLMQLRVAILLFNNILVPCAATAVVSPNCFYYVFTNSAPVDSAATVTVCNEITTDGSCIAYQQITQQYNYLPPYIYSFQCSSTLVTNYASIFVYMYLIDAFVKPLYLAALRYAYVHWSVFRVIGDVLLPSIIKPMDAGNLNVPNKPLVNKHMMVLSMINTCAILLTFGVVFPLLSVVIAVDVVVVTLFSQLMIGRVIEGGNPQLRMQYCEMLNFECDGVESLLRSSVWVLVPVAAAFYSIFLFDTIGDALGWRHALWAPLTMLLTPLAVWLLKFIALRAVAFKSSGIKDTRDNEEQRESEMVHSERDTATTMNPVYGSKSVDFA